MSDSADRTAGSSSFDAVASWEDLDDGDPHLLDFSGAASSPEVQGSFFRGADRRDDSSPVLRRALPAPPMPPREERAQPMFSDEQMAAGLAAVAAASPNLRLLAECQYESRQTLNTGGADAERHKTKGDRRSTYHGAPFGLGPADPHAFFLLVGHVKELVQTMATFALLTPDLERAAMQFVQESLTGAALTTWKAKRDVAALEPAAMPCVGSTSVLFRALELFLARYVSSRAAAEFTAALPKLLRFGPKLSMAALQQNYEVAWGMGVQVAADTSAKHGTFKLEQPSWPIWRDAYLIPQLPSWAAPWPNREPAAFDTMAATFALLIREEPPEGVGARVLQLASTSYDAEAAVGAPGLETLPGFEVSTDVPYIDPVDGVEYLMSAGQAPGVYSMARNGIPVTCFRCRGLHWLKDCQAEMSPEEKANLPRHRWSPVRPVPAQERARPMEYPARPATAPMPFARPGPYGDTSRGAETFVSSVQALPSADAGTMAMFAGQLEALQATQAAQTQVLQHLSTLLVSQMPSSVAVPTVHPPPVARDTFAPSTLHQLATLPPARFGATSPGEHYVPVPSGTPMWLRTDVAEASITEEARALDGASGNV